MYRVRVCSPMYMPFSGVMGGEQRRYGEDLLVVTWSLVVLDTEEIGFKVVGLAQKCLSVADIVGEGVDH